MIALTLSDFGGGVCEQFAANAFAPDSVAAAKGWILDGTNRLRTQWDCEALAVGTSFRAVVGYQTKTDSYLVAITDTHGVVGVNPATGAVQSLGVTVTASHMPWGVTLRESSTYSSRTLTDGTVSSPSTDLRMYAGSAILINSPQAGDAGYVVYESTPGTLAIDTYADPADRYPNLTQHPSIDSFLIPAEGILPHGRRAILWDDRLLICDILWFASDQQADLDTNTTDNTVTYTPPVALSAATTRRYPNAFWVSEPGDVNSYGTLSVDIPVSSDSRIVDMRPIDLGLLVLTTSSSGKDGLMLLNGGSSDYTVQKLRGLGAPRDAGDEDFQLGGDLWEATGVYCYVADNGSIMMSDGQSVVRLDGPQSFDHTSATWRDHLCSVGLYMFASHSGRLLCMRSFGNSGSWSELSMPYDGVQADSLCTVGGDLFFIQNGDLFCFRVSGESYGSMPAGSDVGADEFTVWSSTVDAGADSGVGFSEAQLHRSGVVVGSESSGSVVSVLSASGPGLSPVDSYVVPLGEPVGLRSEFAVRAGVGFVREFAVGAVVSGDVILESLVAWVSPAGRRMR
jgi:hypothetical protein